MTCNKGRHRHKEKCSCAWCSGPRQGHKCPSTCRCRRHKRSIGALIGLAWYGRQESFGIKRALLRFGLLEESCSECGLPPIWNDKLLTLQLDHIDGNTSNGWLQNLRLLCPNCHTQTETYAKAKHPYNGSKKALQGIRLQYRKDVTISDDV
ncbi:hypothetical protein LCGC14_2394770 [marine sediment metagenome]|uniref:HNH nuclease domain-containing protein n=1 Tax=marine sediment metagenome TaxID=412755 RepID=A0A0F9BX65_9ZZZZ